MSFLLCISSSPLFQISQNQKGKRSQITDPSLSSVFTSLNSSAEFVKLLISLFPEAERGRGGKAREGRKIRPMPVRVKCETQSSSAIKGLAHSNFSQNGTNIIPLWLLKMLQTFSTLAFCHAAVSTWDVLLFMFSLVRKMLISKEQLKCHFLWSLHWSPLWGKLLVPDPTVLFPTEIRLNLQHEKWGIK